MQVSIGDIVVGERVRGDVGDLTSLTESLARHGQLSPIVITRRNELVPGSRRLSAARRLGWVTMDAIVTARDSDLDKLEMELDENVLRKDFTPEELLAGYRRLEQLRHPGFLKRVGRFFGQLWGRLFSRRRAEPSRRPATPEEAAAGMGEAV